tara:strand:- start:587 stop:733 length:147 start_codon:yes stop_codon:yes gene_type:complete
MELLIILLLQVAEAAEKMTIVQAEAVVAAVLVVIEQLQVLMYPHKAIQ